jgi:hypothetical protein
MASASGAEAIIAHMKLVIGSKGSHAFGPQLRGILSYALGKRSGSVAGDPSQFCVRLPTVQR